MRKIYCILGQTSSGKTTLEKELIEELSDKINIESLVSTTTRPMRDYEKQYDPYYFITESEFYELNRNKQLAEHTYYEVASGDLWFYGTLKEHVQQEKTYTKVINPKGYRQLCEYFGKENVIGIYIRCDGKERLLRSLKRETNPSCSEVCRRFLADKEDFKGISDTVDFVVENNKTIGEVVKEVAAFILEQI